MSEQSNALENHAPGGESRDEAANAAATGGDDDAARQSGSTPTLRTVVAMVRRIMRADTAAVASFSLADEMITWKATSGFLSRADTDEREVAHKMRGIIAERAATLDELMIIEVVGAPGQGGLPASEFPMHSAEGIRDVALAPLRTRGELLGVLAVGYRTAHRFSIEERQLLEGLAEVAALALDNARLLETVATAKQIWEQTFDAIPDGIIVHDDQMLIARSNAQAAFMMGLERPADAIGMSCADAFERLFGERAAAYHMKQSAGTTATSFELQSEDGRRYLVAVAPLEGIKSEMREAGWCVLTWSDVTELSEVQEQLARSRRLATVGQLAAGVAHEINNPLAAITTCAEAVLRGIRGSAEVSAVADEHNWTFYLEEIVRQALRCKSTTRGLLDLSRQRRARREPVDVNAVTERSVKLFEQRGQECDIAFTLALDPAVGEVATDETMMRQILDNLLSNALDAVSEHGSVNVSTSWHGERAQIEVADTGPGIAPDTLARIFDPFFTTKESGKGSGLGLAISITLAEAIGASITVESKPGAGSRFRLWLPRRMPEQRGHGM